MSARGRKTRLIGSRSSSYGGQSSTQPAGGLLARTGPGRRWIPQVAIASAVLSPTAATFSPENARASSPYSSNFSRTALQRVDRGEHDPLVAPLDETADRLVHLQRVARRLDGDRRHLLGHRRRRLRSFADRLPACSFVRGTRIRQPNSGFVSNHERARAAPTTSPIDGHGRRLDAGRPGVGRHRPPASTRPCAAPVVVPTEVIDDRGLAGRGRPLTAPRPRRRCP